MIQTICVGALSFKFIFFLLNGMCENWLVR